MKIELRPATLRDLCYTLSIARPADKREILAAGPRNLTEAGYLTWHLTEAVGGAGFVVTVDGNPEAAFGFTRQSELTPWLFSGWAWGSDKFDLCMPTIAAWSRTELFPLLDALGCNRVEARSIHDHHDAHRWLLWMQFRREAEMLDWGRDKAKFVLFAWTRTEFEQRARDNVLRGITAAAAATSTNTDHGPSR